MAVDPRLAVTTLPRWAELRRRLPRLLAGVVALGIGISCTVEARLGLSPWDVLHQGVAERAGLDFGVVVIGVGVLVLLAWIPLHQRMGIGTVVNNFGVGLVIMATLALVPHVDALGVRVLLLAGGVLVAGVGTGMYIGAGLGPGPRDGLMTGIAARGPALWTVRTVIEVLALVVGFMLGGTVGVGTVVFAFGIGPVAHLCLRVFHVRAPEAALGPGTTGD